MCAAQAVLGNIFTDTHPPPPHTLPPKNYNTLLYCATRKRAKEQAQKCMPLDTFTRSLAYFLNFLCNFWYFHILWHISSYFDIPSNVLPYFINLWHTFTSSGILYFLMYCTDSCTFSSSGTLPQFLSYFLVFSNLLAYFHNFWHTFSSFGAPNRP